MQSIEAMKYRNILANTEVIKWKHTKMTIITLRLMKSTMHIMCFLGTKSMLKTRGELNDSRVSIFSIRKKYGNKMFINTKEKSP